MSALEALHNASQRYTPNSEIGRGAFSVVVSATDRLSNKKVAIKRISHVFDDAVFAKHVLREVKMLRHLKHPNVISMQDILLEPPNAAHAAAKWIADPKLPGMPANNNSITADQRLYFVSEQMDTDLHAVIQSPQPLSVKHMQYFMYQLLQGTAYLHRARVLHRDLKPENILVNRDCHLKVCDLGLARLDKHAHHAAYLAWSPHGSPSSPASSTSGSSCISANSDLLNSPQSVNSSASDSDSSRNHLADEDFAMTERVVTRWYRAPEVILSMGKYTHALDMWSVACIFAELAGRRPLFPGKDFMEQLHLISGVLGKPTEHEINYFESPKAREFLRALPEKKPVSLATLFPNLDANGLDLLSKMLVFDPRRRMTAEEALRHPFFATLYRAEDHVAAPTLQMMQQAFAFEQNPNLDLPSLRDMILAEMREVLLTGGINTNSSSQVQPMQISSPAPTPSSKGPRRRAENEGSVPPPPDVRSKAGQEGEGQPHDKKMEGSQMDVDKQPATKSEASRGARYGNHLAPQPFQNQVAAMSVTSPCQ